jgi:hypothetical protein
VLNALDLDYVSDNFAFNQSFDSARLAALVLVNIADVAHFLDLAAN